VERSDFELILSRYEELMQTELIVRVGNVEIEALLEAETSSMSSYFEYDISIMGVTYQNNESCDEKSIIDDALEVLSFHRNDNLIEIVVDSDEYISAVDELTSFNDLIEENYIDAKYIEKHYYDDGACNCIICQEEKPSCSEEKQDEVITLNGKKYKLIED
jgi:hypothetical protein